jgi:subtilisin family serine protease
MLALTANVLAATPAFAADPPVPSGMDPGGTAVAVVATGIDYTHPAVAARLARDGEGEIIAWDFVDGDNRPFSGDHTDFGNLMAELLAHTDLRLVPIRVALGAPNWLESAASFAARTPAAIVVLPMANIPVELERLKTVAPRFSKLSFVVVPRTDATAPSIAAAKGLANVGILAAGMCTGHGGAREAVGSIGSRLCQPSQEAGTTGFTFAQ